MAILHCKETCFFICVASTLFSYSFYIIFYLALTSLPLCRRRFLGVSVAGNRRNRFFCSSSRRATLPSSSFFPFLSFFTSRFVLFFPHLDRFKQSDSVLWRETSNDRLNSAIIARDFASISRTQTDTIPR